MMIKIDINKNLEKKKLIKIFHLWYNHDFGVFINNKISKNKG